MRARELKLYLKKAFLSGFVKNVLTTLLTISLLPLIVAEIGMESYGLAMLPFVFNGLIVFADFGLSKAVTFALGNRSSDLAPSEVIGNGLLIVALVVFLLGSGAAVLVFSEVSIFGGSFHNNSAILTAVIIVGCLNISFLLVNNFIVGILEANYLQHHANVSFAISSNVGVAVMYLLAVLSDNLEIVMLGPLIGTITGLLYVVVVAYKRTNPTISLPNLIACKKMLSLSYDFFKISAINAAVVPANKYAIIYLTGSATALAIFEISMRIALMSLSMLTAISQPLLGVFSKKEMPIEKIYYFANRVMLISFAFYVSGVVAFWNFGGLLVNYIDPDNVDDLFKISLILIMGLCGYGCAEPCFRALLGLGKFRQAFKLRVLLPILNLVIITTVFDDFTLSSLTIAYSTAALMVGAVTVIFFKGMSISRVGFG